MDRLSRFVLLVVTVVTVPCGAQQNYCGLLTQPGAVGANPPSGTAEQILKVLSDTAPFNYDSIRLRDARDAELRRQGAAAEICNINQRWIFYDPDFVDQIRVKGQSDWPKYFVFAHEVAHHFNNDPQDHHRDQELQADRAAAHWLTSIGASVQDLVNSINAFVVNERSLPDYPSRCDRIAGVIRAYDEEAEILNRQGGNKPLYDVGDCAPVASSSGSGGLYATRTLEAGTAIQTADVRQTGTLSGQADLPLDFNHDLAGMCAATRVRQGERLTWDNIGVCALMRGR